MFEACVENIVIKNKKVSEIQFNWDIARRPLLQSLSEKDFNLSALLVGRFSALESLSAEWCFCGAIELKNEIQVSQRAKHLRILLCEIQRIAWGIDYCTNIFLEVGDLLRGQMGRALFDAVLNLQEHLTGGRVLPQAFTVGGVRRDLSLGDFEKVREASIWLSEKFSDLLFEFEKDEMVLRNLEKGISIGSDFCQREKLSGPIAQACGMTDDERFKNNSSLNRLREGFSPRLKFAGTEDRDRYQDGSCWSRFRAVCFQIEQSIYLLKKLCINVPEPQMTEPLDESSIENATHKEPELTSKAISYSVETPSGRMTCVLDDSGVNFVSTTIQLSPQLPSLMQGQWGDQVILSLLSLGIDPGQNAIC